MTITYVPRGIHSVTEREPLPVFDEAGTVTEEQVERIMAISKNHRIAEITRDDLRQQIVDLEQYYWPSAGMRADKILAIPRIRDALKLMDDVDAGVVELITYGSKPESSDAR